VGEAGAEVSSLPGDAAPSEYSPTHAPDNSEAAGACPVSDSPVAAEQLADDPDGSAPADDRPAAAAEESPGSVAGAEPSQEAGEADAGVEVADRSPSAEQRPDVPTSDVTDESSPASNFDSAVSPSPVRTDESAAPLDIEEQESAAANETQAESPAAPISARDDEPPQPATVERRPTNELADMLTPPKARPPPPSHYTPSDQKRSPQPPSNSNPARATSPAMARSTETLNEAKEKLGWCVRSLDMTCPPSTAFFPARSSTQSHFSPGLDLCRRIWKNIAPHPLSKSKFHIVSAGADLT
jgi:hypothetical protein